MSRVLEGTGSGGSKWIRFNLASTVLRPASAIPKPHGAGASAPVSQQRGDDEIRILLSAAAALALATTATAATKPAPTKAAATAAKSVRCKDAKGKFIKCPPPVAKAVAKSPVAVAQKSTVKTSVKRCRDAKGRFAKCGTAGAK